MSSSKIYGLSIEYNVEHREQSYDISWTMKSQIKDLSELCKSVNK